MASSISEALRRRAVGSVVVLAMLLGAPPVARAQDELARPAIGSDPNREAARVKLVEGVAALKRGDHRAALARFEEAYALVPSPKIHYDFGLAYVGLGRSADALASFERFLAEATDAPSDKRDKAASMIASLRARGTERAARSDGEAASAPPMPAGPPPAVSGGATGVASSPPDAGLVAAPKAEQDPMRTRRIAAISIGGAGAGLLAAGLVFGLLAQREDDSLTRDSQAGSAAHPTPFDPGKESRGIAYERLEVIGLVAGAVAVAAGAALYATTRRRVVVEPVAGQTVAGIDLRVTF